MFNAALTAALVILSTVQTATATPIHNGDLAAKYEIPSIASIERLNHTHFCGATLLNADTILTAAHCTPALPVFEVRVGSLNRLSGGTLVSVLSATPHPDYNPSNSDNDIAIWKLATPFAESPAVRYAKLPAQHDDPAVYKPTVTIAGWGKLNSADSDFPELLRKVTLPVVSRDACASVYSDRRRFPDPDHVFCAGLEAGGKDSCQGDSGGPVFDADTGVLIGVTTGGLGCGRAGYYGVYTRVGKHVDFIRQHM